MKSVLVLAVLIAVALPTPSARAQPADVIVASEFIVDPMIGGGGYEQLTITNGGSTPIYALAVGQNTSEVVYTSPALAGQFYSLRGPRAVWEAGEFFSGGDFGYVAPQTQLLDWDTYLGPGYVQAIGWQLTAIGSPVAPGETLVGLRYLPGEGAGAARAEAGPLPFIAFDAAGGVAAFGFTVTGDPVPVATRQVSRLKAAFR